MRDWTGRRHDSDIRVMSLTLGAFRVGNGVVSGRLYKRIVRKASKWVLVVKMVRVKGPEVMLEGERAMTRM